MTILDRSTLMRVCPDCGNEYLYGPLRCPPCSLKHRRELKLLGRIRRRQQRQETA